MLGLLGGGGMSEVYRALAPHELQALWPALAPMKDGDDLETFASRSVRNHIGCAWNHEFARAGDSSRTP